jgi:hypothetical protein
MGLSINILVGQFLYVPVEITYVNEPKYKKKKATILFIHNVR